MSSIDQFAAHIGLDWADKKHDVCIQFNNGDRFNSAKEIQNYSVRGSFCTSGTDQVPEAGNVRRRLMRSRYKDRSLTLEIGIL